MVVSKALHYAGQVVLGVLGTVQGGGVEYRAVAVPQRPLFKRSVQSGTSYRSLPILTAEKFLYLQKKISLIETVTW